MTACWAGVDDGNTDWMNSDRIAEHVVLFLGRLAWIVMFAYFCKVKKLDALNRLLT